MKKYRFKQRGFFIFLLASILFAFSFQSVDEAEPYATFLGKDNKEYTILLAATQVSNFQDSLIRVAFKRGESFVNVKGAIAFLSKERDAYMIPEFISHIQLTKYIRGFVGNGKLKVGEAIVLTRLEEIGTKKFLPNFEKTY